MSIKNALLSLLSTKAQAPSQVRQEFHDRTNNAWPLNIGQVTQTLGRLKRDGLIESAGEHRPHQHHVCGHRNGEGNRNNVDGIPRRQAKSKTR